MMAELYGITPDLRPGDDYNERAEWEDILPRMVGPFGSMAWLFNGPSLTATAENIMRQRAMRAKTCSIAFLRQCRL